MPKRSGECLACGYENVGLAPTGRCPECGARVTDIREAIDPEAVQGRRRRVVAVAAVGGLLVLIAYLVARAVSDIGR